MNFVYKILATILIIPFIFAGMIFLANWGYLDNAIRHGAEYYCSIKGYDCHIKNLKFNHGNLTVNEIRINNSHANHSINLKNISAELVINLANFNASSQIKTGHFAIIQDDEKHLLSSNIVSDILIDSSGIKLFNVLLSEILLPEIDTSNSHIEFSFDKNTERANFLAIINLNQSSFLHSKVVKTYQNKSEAKGASNIGEMTAYATFQNIPVELTKLAQIIAPDIYIFNYLSNSLKSGIITKGSLDININDDDLKNNYFDQNHISASFAARDVTYSYHPDMPKVTHANINGYTKGMTTELILSDASIAGFNFPGTKITVDLEERSNKEVRVTGIGSGSFAGLTEFIPANTMTDLKTASIDLTKFTGSADVGLNLIIPLNEGKHNSFDIRAEIPQTSVEIFNDNIKLSEASLSGQLLDQDLHINGKGLINGLASSLEFKCCTDSSNHSHQLTIKSSITEKDNIKDEASLIKYSGGAADIIFDYTYANDSGDFKLYSDLTGLNLYVDRLGIHKVKGESAILDATGKFNKPSGYDLDFTLNGKQKLDIQGSVAYADGTTNISIPTLKHKDTDISMSISHGDNTDIRLSGKVLDLHNADLFKFMQKGKYSQNGNMLLKANIKEIKLKNDIWLDNLIIDLGCNIQGCFEGKIDADIGSRSIKATASLDGENESWEISSSNAGATLKALGMYNEMRAGTLKLNIQTAKQQVKPGEVIPISYGNFTVEKFGLGNTPFLTRMISAVSLPGFLGMITNNNDILFSSMNGEFIFDDNIIEVKNSLAEGPFFSFSLRGDIDIANRNINVKGHVTPELYGISSMVKTIPLVGKFLAGDKSSAGLLSASYKIQQDY